MKELVYLNITLINSIRIKEQENIDRPICLKSYKNEPVIKCIIKTKQTGFSPDEISTVDRNRFYY